MKNLIYNSIFFFFLKFQLKKSISLEIYFQITTDNKIDKDIFLTLKQGLHYTSVLGRYKKKMVNLRFPNIITYI